MLNETVQFKPENCSDSEERPIVTYKDGRPVFRGRLDTTAEGILCMSELITQFALQVEREGKR